MMLSSKALIHAVHVESFSDFPIAKPLQLPSMQCNGSSCFPRKNLICAGYCLIYWHDVKLSSAIFLCIFLLLLCLVLYPLLSIFAYLSLSYLTISFTFCCLKGFRGILKHTTYSHPFRRYLNHDICIPEDAVYDLIETVTKFFTLVLMTFKNLVFISDVKSSIKFYLFLWLMVPVGMWFSDMCLVLICTVALFTVPKFYQEKKVQVYLCAIKQKFRQLFTRVKEKV